MAHTGNGKTLLGGSGGEQSARAAEEDLFQLAVFHPVEQVGAQGNGAAPAAGTTGMHILRSRVKDHRAAIVQIAVKRNAVTFG